MKTIYGENVRLENDAYYWIRMSWGDEVACYNAGLSKKFLRDNVPDEAKEIIKRDNLVKASFELSGMENLILLDNPDFIGIIERVYHPRRKRSHGMQA